MATDDVTGGLAELNEAYAAIREQLDRFVVGNVDLKELVFIGLLSGGHILIEGYPGTAKTSLVKSLARVLGCRFSRFQCAVDSQPADIIGVRIFHPDSREFVMKRGPIFTNFMLIDEINRLAPKTQGAFIEAMSERQATVDGETIPIESPFMVIATQNPFEFEGTFPLIEAQKDRFMFSTRMGHLEEDDELELIRREFSGELDWASYTDSLAPVLDEPAIKRFISLTREVHIEGSVLGYIRDLVIATRKHGDIRIGVSARGSISLVRGSRAMAALAKRSYVIPDDVKRLIPMVFSHRVVLTREAEISGVTPDQVIREITDAVEVP